MAGHSATRLDQREQIKKVSDYGDEVIKVFEPDVSGEFDHDTTLGGSDTITAHGSTTTLTAATATFRTDGVVAGDMVEISGSTNNDGQYKIISVDSETELTVDGTLNVASPDGTADITSIRNLETDIMHMMRQLQRIIGGPGGAPASFDSGEWKDKPQTNLYDISLAGVHNDLNEAYDDSPTGNKFIDIDDGGLLLNDSQTDEPTFVIDRSGAITTGAPAIDIDYTGSINSGTDECGIDLDGVTNAGAGDSIGLCIDGFDKSIDVDGSVDIGGLTTLDGATLADRTITSDTTGMEIETTTAGDLKLTSAGELVFSDSRVSDFELTDAANSTLDCGGTSIFGAINAVCNLFVHEKLFLETGSVIRRGDNITIPESETYFGELPTSSGDQSFGSFLNVYANGQLLTPGSDVGGGYERDYHEAADGTGQTTIKATRRFPLGTRFHFFITKA